MRAKDNTRVSAAVKLKLNHDDSEANKRQSGALIVKPESVSQLKFFYTNADSIVNKMSEFHARTANNNYDVIGIVESWATEHIRDSELSLEGYVLYRKDRRNEKGGGVLLYIKDTLNSCTDEICSAVDFGESIWCTIDLVVSKLLIGLCYRKPTSTILNDDKLLDVLKIASRHQLVDHLVIFGDFNYPEIDFNNYCVAGRPESGAYSFLKQHKTSSCFSACVK